MTAWRLLQHADFGKTMDIHWYINRLRKMTPLEIPWRILEKIKKIKDDHKRFASPKSADMPDPSLFLLSPQSPSLPIGLTPGLKPLTKIANKIMSNQLDVFGIPTRVGTPQDWHMDPLTRKHWPQQFWGKINIRKKDLGGVKFVWETNRLYFLFPLALSYRFSGEKKYCRHILSLIRSWSTGNPYPMGINWSSTIEAGVRLANLVWALSFLEAYPFTRKDLEAVNTFVFYHASHLDRYPSRYSSANNHLLAEAFGLFLAGLYFPHLPGAAQWFTRGKKLVEQQIDRQILADGGSFEYSTTYLSFVIDFFSAFQGLLRPVWYLLPPPIGHSAHKGLSLYPHSFGST